jgi:SagB-type dehydrogenase family enzyme
MNSMEKLVADNRDIRVARHYHLGTKHPGGYLLNPGHLFDPARLPRLFKQYRDLESIALDLDIQPLEVPALSTISTNILAGHDTQIPDRDTLARLLFFSAGVTKRINYPHWGEKLFRAAACTGALYHIELYAICGDLPGLAAGVYHFDPNGLALVQLREGDHRGSLVFASGNEPAIAHAPLILVYTDVFWRNACKYQAREYRHAFWDSGTILSHTLAMASAYKLPARIIAGFIDSSVNELLGLDREKEVALALAPIGFTPDRKAAISAAGPPLFLETLPISGYEIDFPPIREMHEASSLSNEEEVIAWRGEAPQLAMLAPSDRLVALRPFKEKEMSQDPVEHVIIRRGSTRYFSREAITFQQLSTILTRSLLGIPTDFLQPVGTTLNLVYLIINAVEGLEPGSYVLHRDMYALERLKGGIFRGEAGHLALGQDLAANASVALFFLTDLELVLRRFGNRGYRAAQLDASVAAGRIYLAAYAQGLGATGLTFYDDAVTEFFSSHARDKSVMFLIAIGKRARRLTG